MFVLWLCYVLVIGYNRIVVHSLVLPSLNDEGGLSVYQELPRGSEFAVRRGRAEIEDEQDFKERRNKMGSSFIRFGRSNGPDNLEVANEFANESDDSKVDRYPRFKSPDIVIRFGRRDVKGSVDDRANKRGRNDNFIRFGRNPRILPAYIDVPVLCSEILSGEADGTSSCKDCARPYVSRLVKLCKIVRKVNGAEQHNSIDRFDFLDENGSTIDAKQE